jgi:hypothetical protein
VESGFGIAPDAITGKLASIANKKTINDRTRIFFIFIY